MSMLVNYFCNAYNLHVVEYSERNKCDGANDGKCQRPVYCFLLDSVDFTPRFSVFLVHTTGDIDNRYNYLDVRTIPDCAYLLLLSWLHAFLRILPGIVAFPVQ